MNKDFREEGSQIIERHEHSIGGGLANVTDEEVQMAKDRCGQCGSPRASSIHNRESNNVEIRLASHAFVEALPPRTLAELQSELKQVEGAYLSEINPDTKYLLVLELVLPVDHIRNLAEAFRRVVPNVSLLFIPPGAKPRMFEIGE